MSCSIIIPEDMRINKAGATRLGLFIGLGEDPDHWSDGYIKIELIENKLNEKEEKMRSSYLRSHLENVVLRY
jgi:hypothetical protein